MTEARAVVPSSLVHRPPTHVSRRFTPAASGPNYVGRQSLSSPPCLQTDHNRFRPSAMTIWRTPATPRTDHPLSTLHHPPSTLRWPLSSPHLWYPPPPPPNQENHRSEVAQYQFQLEALETQMLMAQEAASRQVPNPHPVLCVDLLAHLHPGDHGQPLALRAPLRAGECQVPPWLLSMFRCAPSPARPACSDDVLQGSLWQAKNFAFWGRPPNPTPVDVRLYPTDVRRTQPTSVARWPSSVRYQTNVPCARPAATGQPLWIRTRVLKPD